MLYAIDVRCTKLFLGNRLNFMQRSLNSRASDADDVDATMVADVAMDDVVCVTMFCCFVFVIVLAVPPVDVTTASWHEVNAVAAVFH